MFLACWHEFGNRKGRGYNLSVGPAYTVTLLPVDRDLDVHGQFNNSDESHIFEYREKLSLEE
ncbi:hypothetical protein N7463_008313 [Penicillium fimorum]|uniref:Uncharacterized protein n=1 Tax=Penicillium fimorum TaxID=1882269 RepID=A0A9W9XNN0_9EURO|nr:hypothetical protein N7463_008313 [Penicillium fimorum]